MSTSTAPRRIVFYDIEGTRIGKVDIIDDKLVPEKRTEGYTMYWEVDGGTPDSFVDYFRKYTNGHVSSREVDPENDPGDK